MGPSLKNSILLNLLWIPLLVSPTLAKDDISKIAKKLAKGASHLENKKVGILAFPYHNDRISSGSSVVSERLTTRMVNQNKLRVIERRMLRKLLEEKKLSETGVIDQKTAFEMGKVLGVDVIVTGTLIDLDDGRTEVNARLIETKTGEILAASKGYMKRTWADRPRAVKPVASKPKMNKRGAPSTDYDPEFVEEPEDREEASYTPSRKLKKGLNLTNESFSPGRRIYHSTKDKPKKKRRKKQRDYEDNEYEEEYEYYDPGYNTGYYDGYYQGRAKEKAKAKKKQKKKKKTKTMHERSIEKFRTQTRKHKSGDLHR